MDTSGPVISQKEYLKKYLSKGKKKKKKPKISSSTILKRSQIIDDDDDDLGLKNMASIDDDEFNLDYLGDEAPQIAGVIDERPLEVQGKEMYGNKRLWKDLGETEASNDDSNSNSISKQQHFNKKSKLNNEIIRDNDTKISQLRKGKRKEDSGSDFSPPRKSKKKYNKNHSDSDMSPPRVKHEKERDGDHQRFRKEGSKTTRNLKKTNSDSDMSPPRSRYRGKDKEEDYQRSGKSNRKSNKNDSDSDMSPPRSRHFGKSKNEYHQKRGKSNRKSNQSDSDSDVSLPRSGRHEKEKKKVTKYDNSDGEQKIGKKYNKGIDYKMKIIEIDSDSDLSPPRSRKISSETASRMIKHSLKYQDGQSRRGNNEEERSRRRRSSDDDMSPPRKSHKESDEIRKSRHSPSPTRRKDSSSKRYEKGRDKSSSPGYRDKRNGPSSSKFKYDFDVRKKKNKREKSSSPEFRNKKMEKTLDGKQAGLQNASNLKEEIQLLKQNEDRMFKEISTNLSGQGVAPILRDRKTGKKRDLEKEKEEEVRKNAKLAERNSKYKKWGKGLKQVEEKEKKISDVLHEMTKPLARYANDQDLENFLKAQEREGDPMLEYMRQQQTESINCQVSGKPKYQGSFMPNRFGIPPGHRWDGVDRSNGYEHQWFEARNAKKALEEEAYKWSTSDM